MAQTMLIDPISKQKVVNDMANAIRIAAAFPKLDVPLAWRAVIKQYQAMGHAIKYRPEGVAAVAKWLGDNIDYVATAYGYTGSFTVENLSWKNAAGVEHSVDMRWLPMVRNGSQVMLWITMVIDNKCVGKLIANIGDWSYKYEQVTGVDAATAKVYVHGALLFFAERLAPKRGLELFGLHSALVALGGADGDGPAALMVGAQVMNKIYGGRVYEYYSVVEGVAMWKAVDRHMTKYYIEGAADDVARLWTKIEQDYPMAGYGTSLREVDGMVGAYEGSVFHSSD